MTTDLVRYGVDGRGVATVTLDDPATRNALGDDLLDQLIGHLQSARDDEAVRVVVLAASGDRVFSSGGNLKAFADDRPVIEKYAGLDRFPRLFRLIGDLGKPTICAAGGDVLAGAFGLALACDLVIARSGVRFGCPEINVGVFPFMISALIYRSVPRAKANELMMLGDLIDADQALALHIVNAVVPAPEFAATVDAWAGRIAAKSPLLMRLGKQALAVTRDLALGEALSHLQAQLALALTTSDVGEGVAAFREKRDPEWRMR
ncbi:Enoyl-CoA hydratase/carnithine racemase [Nakamurella panacisegetis]|uniref:Enoyl-CoA hydratase/carnithine racemase n=1 Tax=Nakamurella panacisegetis TaxID=1090615 RepID=A0A1H0QRN9_9ACTN|nr:enoyl-CoA hydratase/isomerase family protein [Nakamurella panacisegetis]SDP19376.1 Enoyl-CoA hydratase/carnithine racemase [Nakamurella panacisegetis]